MSHRFIIYRKTLDSAQVPIPAMRKIGLNCIEPANRVSLTLFAQCHAMTSSALPQANADLISDYRINPESPFFRFSPEIKETILQNALKYSSVV